jgi:hypothetical protein
MIYASSKASGVPKSHHLYSPKPKAELNNGMFTSRAHPELKTCCYFALMSYVTILFTK